GPTSFLTADVISGVFTTTNLGFYPGFNPTLLYDTMSSPKSISLMLTAGSEYTWADTGPDAGDADSWSPMGGPPSSGDTGIFPTAPAHMPTLAGGDVLSVGTLSFQESGVTFSV